MGAVLPWYFNCHKDFFPQDKPNMVATCVLSARLLKKNCRQIIIHSDVNN